MSSEAWGLYTGLYNDTKEAKLRYADIENWYKKFLTSDKGANWIEQFNKLIPEHDKLTDLKKVDLILWQTRG